MTVRILHTADLQIGRIPSRLPPGVQASPTQTWDHIVAYAIENRLDAVTLGGDIVDAENRFYEAYGPLEQGIRRLFEAGVPVIGVAGNHDVDVFPHLADALGEQTFRLLGRGGHWERHTLQQDGRPVLHIDGWSFPTQKVTNDPVKDYRPEGAGDAPVVGLVHGDLDQSQSVYAPISKARLLQHDIAAWLLGHVHKPLKIEDANGPLILYPGSPQGLDPGEPGLHGAWELEFDATGLQGARLVPMASVIYEHHSVDLDQADSQQEVKKRIVQSTTHHLETLAQKETGPLQHVVYRLHLTGRTPLHSRLPAILAGLNDELNQEGLRLERGRLGASVDKTYPETTPALDLQQLAQGTGPPASLARVLIALSADEPDDPLARQLLREAVATIDELDSSVHYLRLQADQEDPQEGPGRARRLLREKGLLLLDALIQQKQEPQEVTS